MNIRDAFQSIVEQWPEYRELGKVDGSHPTHELVTKVVPESLMGSLSDTRFLRAHGSTGLGNITAAPWVAIFHTVVTNSATRGYYLVYLISIDLQRLYLCLGLGATQFNTAFPSKRRAYMAMESASARMLDVIGALVPKHLEGRLDTGLLDLNASAKERLHSDYEHANIYSLRYELNDLPTEGELLADFKAFVQFLRAIVADPLTPDPVSLLDSTARLISLPASPTLKGFSPRPPKGKAGATGGGTHRYSKQAKIVGDRAEKIVLEAERKKLSEAGRSDLAGRIVHEEAIGNRPGWDISSFDETGNPIFIEVKATDAATMTSVELTVNEWQAAQRSTHADCHYLYLVTNTLSPNPSIEIIRNPKRYVEAGELELTPCRFTLSLRSKE